MSSLPESGYVEGAAGLFDFLGELARVHNLFDGYDPTDFGAASDLSTLDASVTAHLDDDDAHVHGKLGNGFELNALATQWRTKANPLTSRLHVLCMGDSNTEATSYTSWVARLRRHMRNLYGDGGRGYVPFWRPEWSE